MSLSQPIERDVIVVGGSAGSLSVLQALLRELPSDLPAAVFVLIHQSQNPPGQLLDALSRFSALPAEHAVDGKPMELGRVYVAPPNRHLLLDRGYMRLSNGPRENRFRPAIDPLFRTAARAYGPQVIGVILSGFLDDGTLGCMRIKQFGGTVIAQDPHSAEAPSMPASVIRNVGVDHILKPDDIASTLIRLIRHPAPEPDPAAAAQARKSAPELSAAVPSETGDTADRGDSALTAGAWPGHPTGLTCPECGGAVWENNENGVLTYRCHVGHAYTADSMADDHASHLEGTLWAAVRMFQESASLQRRMERRYRDDGDAASADRFASQAAEQERRTELMRTLLLREASN